MTPFYDLMVVRKHDLLICYPGFEELDITKKEIIKKTLFKSLFLRIVTAFDFVSDFELQGSEYILLTFLYFEYIHVFVRS